MPLFEVEVPNSLGPGDPFFLEACGTTVEVVVPDGCIGGSLITVDVTLPDKGNNQRVEVTVPEGAMPGDNFLVDVTGQQFEVTVPEDLGPGSILTIELPAPIDPVPDSTDVEPTLRYTEPDLGLSDEALLETGGRSNRHPLGHPVEVRRSDGTWSLAVAEDFDYLGYTYTIRLADGRCKYMVEEDDLRIPRFLLRSPVSLEITFFSGGGRDNKVSVYCMDEEDAPEEEKGALAERSSLTQSALTDTRWIVRGMASGETLLDVVVTLQPQDRKSVV